MPIFCSQRFTSLLVHKTCIILRCTIKTNTSLFQFLNIIQCLTKYNLSTRFETGCVLWCYGGVMVLINTVEEMFTLRNQIS